jgi:hypothetical protein
VDFEKPWAYLFARSTLQRLLQDKGVLTMGAITEELLNDALSAVGNCYPDKLEDQGVSPRDVYDYALLEIGGVRDGAKLVDVIKRLHGSIRGN